MKVYIEDILVGGERAVDISGKVTIPKTYSEFTTVPVNIKGTLKKEADSLSFKGRASADLRLRCDLCLTEFSKRIDFDVFGIFKRETDEGEEAYAYSSNLVDLEPMVYTELLLNFPMRNVCREDCKGLCIKCGHNLNEGDCGCYRGEINPEFEKLKAMFNEE